MHQIKILLTRGDETLYHLILFTHVTICNASQIGILAYMIERKLSPIVILIIDISKSCHFMQQSTIY